MTTMTTIIIDFRLKPKKLQWLQKQQFRFRFRLRAIQWITDFRDYSNLIEQIDYRHSDLDWKRFSELVTSVTSVATMTTETAI